MVACRMCRERGQTWAGDAPRCAFPDMKPFQPSNWNCATANALRAALGEFEGEQPPGVFWHCEEDQKQALILISADAWPDNEGYGEPPRALWVCWYKRRGCTEAMWFLAEDMAPFPPNEAQLRHVVACLVAEHASGAKLPPFLRGQASAIGAEGRDPQGLGAEPAERDGEAGTP